MVAEEVATDKQIAYVRSLLASRRMPKQMRADVEALLDRIMSKGEAMQVIPMLKEMPQNWDHSARLPRYDGSLAPDYEPPLSGYLDQSFIPEPTPEELAAQRQLAADFAQGVADHNLDRPAPQQVPYDIRLALAKVINDSDGFTVLVTDLRQIIAEANEAERTVGVRD